MTYKYYPIQGIDPGEVERTMGRAIGRGMLKSAESGYETSDVVFGKKGSEIQGSISKKIELTLKDIEDNKKEIAAICKNRGLEVQEVLEAADDEEKIEAYSNKVYSNSGNPKQNSVVRELQADIDRLKALTWGTQSAHAEIDKLKRISSNIEPGRSFDLSYRELVAFGF